MDQSLTHRIRERAYEIWTADGCPEGQAAHHWFAAEREILQVPKTMLAAKTAGKKMAGGARKAKRPPLGSEASF